MSNKKRNLPLKENIRLAFRGLFTHKMRSFLTMLGIIIGIAAIIAISSTIKGTNEQIKQNLIGSGTNTVTVTLNQGDYSLDYYDGSLPDGVGTVSEDTVKSLSALNHVTSVSLFRTRTYADLVYRAETSLSGGTVLGIDKNYLSTAGLQVVSGRGFVEEDYKEHRKVMLVDETAAETLFGGSSPLGGTVEIKGEPFTVVGLVQKRSTFEPVIESEDDYWTYNQTSSGTVYITTDVWPILYMFDEPESVLLGIDNTDSITEVGKAAAVILNNTISPTDTTIKYSAQDLLKQAQDLQSLSNSTNSMLIWVAAISLLVGGIGVMNIMLVSVTERTREIGLKKALGARKKSILIQFLTEAAVLTSIGGIIGILAGIGLAYIISAFASIPVAISAPSIIISFVFSAAIGIIFGLLPSVKAADLDPIEALRYE